MRQRGAGSAHRGRAAAAAEAEAEAQQPVENRKYTRGSLFGALRDTVADKGIAALNKRMPPNFRG